MKKIILVILSILLCFAMFVSCSNGGFINHTEKVESDTLQQDETPKDETPKDETPKDETPKDETPKDETPKDETPKDETPKDETPKDETPKDETPKDETPKDETPKDETPKDETPKDETPKDETPKDEPTEEPKVEPVIVDPTVNINGNILKWSLGSGVSQSFRTPSTPANNKFEVNIPVTEAGTYNLKFNANMGLTRVTTSGTKTVSLALPKTVFQVGEPITVVYRTSGFTNATTLPWLAITKNVNGVDKYVYWEYVEWNYTNALNVKAMTGQREDDTVKAYVGLPAGEYKLYFISPGTANVRDTSHWLLNEPINISIVPKGSVGTTVTRNGTAYGSASLSVTNNILAQGESIYTSFSAKGLNTSYSGDRPWVAVSKTLSTNSGFYDYYTHWYYTEATHTGMFRFDSTSGNYPENQSLESYRSLPAGSYKIHYVNGSNLKDCVNYVEPIGINIAPKATLNASVGGTSILSTTDPYDITSVNKTITVTEADAARGYVTVSFTFGSLKAGIDYFLTVNNVSLIKQ